MPHMPNGPDHNPIRRQPQVDPRPTTHGQDYHIVATVVPAAPGSGAQPPEDAPAAAPEAAGSASEDRGALARTLDVAISTTEAGPPQLMHVAVLQPASPVAAEKVVPRPFPARPRHSASGGPVFGRSRRARTELWSFWSPGRPRPGLKPSKLKVAFSARIQKSEKVGDFEQK